MSSAVQTAIFLPEFVETCLSLVSAGFGFDAPPTPFIGASALRI